MFHLQYLKKVIEEVSLELEGNSELILDKYVLIAFDFLIDFMESMLRMPGFQEEIEKNELLKKYSPFKVLLELKKTKGNFSHYIDDNLRRTLNLLYHGTVMNYRDGILNTEGRYNSLFIGFLQAQITYKKFLEGQIKLLENLSAPDYIKLKTHIESLEIHSFINGLKALFASIPNVLIKNTTEAYYHIFIHLILTLIGCDYKSEVNTNLGRIDGVLETENHINVIEFKLDSTEDGMEQIIRKKYYELYLDKGKEINLISLSFCKKERNIKGFDVKLNFKE